MANIKINSALISVFDKSGLEPIIKELNKLNIELISTGGTQEFIEKLNIKVTPVEEITLYPSILGGRVKTLHPKIFGGILKRSGNVEDKKQLEEFKIPQIDLVIVDLYPFEDTVKSGKSHQEIIEKIDIGGISLIRASAKNYEDVLIVSSQKQYLDLLTILIEGGISTREQRMSFARDAFNVSSDYDTHIYSYFNKQISDSSLSFKKSFKNGEVLRYGENPHQNGIFYGNLNVVFDKIQGKDLSYNNLLDVDSAVNLMLEFKNDIPTFAILKHNNACGISSRKTIKDAYIDAFAGDPVSAFGGILISNVTIDFETAKLINELFFEVIIAPSYNEDAIECLSSKKNRIILVQKSFDFPKIQFRTILNGILEQDKDLKIENENDLKLITTKSASKNEIDDLIFANKIVKHTKSNTIVLAKNKQLLASGTGQTSRVDALNQAIHKAKTFQFNLKGAVMASDAFFPFPDCVEIANKEGVNTVIQPGGSIKDDLSISYCNEHGMSMYLTGIRHFKH